MALMVPRTPQLMNVTAQTGALTGHWFTPWPNDVREHHVIDVALTAGTATFFVEGRNSPLDTAVTIVTGSASVSTLAIRYNQVRVRLSAATGATLLATVDRPAKDTGA